MQKKTNKTSKKGLFVPNMDFSTISEVMFYAPFEVEANNMLKWAGLNPFAVPSCFHPLYMRRYDGAWVGIGIRNVNGGYEFWNASLPRPVTVLQKGLVYIQSKALPNTKVCFVFLDILDYLSYRTYSADEALQRVTKLPYDEFSDIYVLNSYSNFIDLMTAVKSYATIHTFFPTNDCGKVMYKTLEQFQENGAERLHDWSSIYSATAVTLDEYVRG